MVPVVQLVRASDCGSECRGFESHRAPYQVPANIGLQGLFVLSKSNSGKIFQYFIFT